MVVFTQLSSSFPRLRLGTHGFVLRILPRGWSRSGIIILLVKRKNWALATGFSREAGFYLLSAR
jgi:hypothetical protein